MTEIPNSAALHALDNQVASAEKRAAANAYLDGFADFVVAITFLATAGLFALEWRVLSRGGGTGVSAIGLPVVVLGTFVLARLLLPIWRERVTYPRVGYALPRRRPSRTVRVAALVTGGVLGALVAAFVVVRPESTLRWITALQGIGVGALLALVGYASGRVRFLVLAAFAVAVGIAITALGVGQTAASAAFFGLVGLAALLSGIVTFLGFLGDHPGEE